MKKLMLIISLFLTSTILIACEETPPEVALTLSEQLDALEIQMAEIASEIEAINEALSLETTETSELTTLQIQLNTLTAEMDDLTASFSAMATTISLLQPEEIMLDELSYASYLSDTNPEVTMVIKDVGTMTLQLFPDVAPNSVNNMIKLIEEGFYDGLIFHRVIEGFMIQGGWASLIGRTDSSCVIQGEFESNGIENPLEHDRGVLSYARTSVKDSATSQFFIMHAKSPHLDGQYAAFGGLTSGFNVLDHIATVSKNAQDRPLTDVIIESVTIDLKGQTYPDPVCIN